MITKQLHDGWRMRVAGDRQWFPAQVPGSVYQDLLNSGMIDDPYDRDNELAALAVMDQDFEYELEFDTPAGMLEQEAVLLRFEGIDTVADLELNGMALGHVENMHRTWEFPVKDALREKENRLRVCLRSPTRYIRQANEKNPLLGTADAMEGFPHLRKAHCMFGWDWGPRLPDAGIWRAVSLMAYSAARLDNVYITQEHGEDAVTLRFQVQAVRPGEASLLDLSAAQTAGLSCRAVVTGPGGEQWEAGGQALFHSGIVIQTPRLWWPNGYGEQALYEVLITVEPDDDLPQVFREVTGLRQIEMRPLPDGPREDFYNWTFTVNGREIFIKGTNWCTTDALLRFSDERYDRFLSLAKAQHLQLLRAWGGGIPESDYFYRKCDELGLMVAQEWPTCWDSQKVQPFEVLEETARLHTVRLRNHPSLVQWAGGNESAAADGAAMDMFGRIAYELDGTRPFHRTSPYGGSLHSYNTYWDMEEMDAALNLRAPFIGEFGMASCPNRESVYRYIPAEERGTWDPAAKNAFNYHTPRFNEFRWPEDYNDMDHLLKRAEEFGPIDSLDDFIFDTQMAQSTAIRHTLEAARAAWPQAAGICYYKLTDVYPACSWATVDYYGVPKSSYYVLAQAFAPLHAMLLIRSIHAAERYPLYLLDDAGEAAGRRCAVTVQFFDGGLRLIGSETREIVPTTAVNPLGDVALPAALAGDGPVLIHVRLTVDGVQADDTVYWQNYKENPGCLKALPSAALEVREAGAGYARIVNTGSVPAAGVLVECPAHDTEFTCDAGVFWLDAGESRTVAVSHTDGLRLSAFNVKETQC